MAVRLLSMLAMFAAMTLEGVQAAACTGSEVISLSANTQVLASVCTADLSDPTWTYCTSMCYQTITELDWPDCESGGVNHKERTKDTIATCEAQLAGSSASASASSSASSSSSSSSSSSPTTDLQESATSGSTTSTPSQTSSASSVTSAHSALGAVAVLALRYLWEP